MNNKITAEDLKKLIDRPEMFQPKNNYYISKSYANWIKEQIGYVPDYYNIVDDQLLPNETKGIKIKSEIPFYKNRRK